MVSLRINARWTRSIASSGPLMPNELWVSDFTFVSTWRGFVYVAFVIDTFANRIVGWKASTTQDTQFVLDALEQAIHARRPAEKLIHHSDRGSQYVSIKYTERLADAGLEPSVGSVGDSYDNALAETIIGLFKTEVINRLGPWKSKDQVEWETLQWVDWFNKERPGIGPWNRFLGIGRGERISNPPTPSLPKRMRHRTAPLPAKPRPY